MDCNCNMIIPRFGKCIHEVQAIAESYFPLFHRYEKLALPCPMTNPQIEQLCITHMDTNDENLLAMLRRINATVFQMEETRVGVHFLIGYTYYSIDVLFYQPEKAADLKSWLEDCKRSNKNMDNATGKILVSVKSSNDPVKGYPKLLQIAIGNNVLLILRNTETAADKKLSFFLNEFFEDNSFTFIAMDIHMWLCFKVKARYADVSLWQLAMIKGVPHKELPMKDKLDYLSLKVLYASYEKPKQVKWPGKIYNEEVYKNFIACYSFEIYKMEMISMKLKNVRWVTPFFPKTRELENHVALDEDAVERLLLMM